MDDDAVQPSLFDDQVAEPKTMGVSTSRKRDGSAGAAERMAKTQRDISVSEFFTKNRHLLGFDSPRKALLTAVKEAVDNSLDACEEGRIRPEVLVGQSAQLAARVPIPERRAVLDR